MASEIVMPRLSDSMEEGTILKWLKADGDAVERGDPLAEIETDKATLTYESDAAGVLTVVAAAGETHPIGALIARLDGHGAAPGEPERRAAEAAPREPERPAAEAAPREPERPAAEAAAGEPERPAGAAGAEREGAAPPAQRAPPSGAKATGRLKASPVARRIAGELGVDLHRLSGSGPGGRIVRADVEDAARDGVSAPPAAQAEQAPPEQAPPEQAPPAPAREQLAPPAPRPAPAATRAETGAAKGDVTVQELTRTQQLIARRMAESKATIPDFALRTEIEMEAAVRLRGELKALGGDVPSYNDMVVKAAALALREFPRANGSYRDGRFELHGRVNVGVAVAAPDALVVPTIFDADAKALREIARETRALAERVRAGTVTPPELSGGTFTVSNLGMYGVSDFTAVINPPQAAILAVGELAPRAVVREGELVARHMMLVTLACDHRILYGAEAAQFLARIRALLEQPLALAF